MCGGPEESRTPIVYVSSSRSTVELQAHGATTRSKYTEKPLREEELL